MAHHPQDLACDAVEIGDEDHVVLPSFIIEDLDAEMEQLRAEAIDALARRA